MSFHIKSPTRVDLAGGTLDCWPLYLLVGGTCLTVNLSMSIFTYAELDPKQDESIDIHITDLGYKKQFSSLKELLESKDEELGLVRVHFDYWKPKRGFSLTTRSESPVGGGLGGSSSLSISLIKAFSQWLGHKLSTEEMVTLASNLEAQVLKTPTGTQDYYPAIQPGLNLIHYGPEGRRLETLDVPMQAFQERLLLVYTGKPHHSGLNNWQVIKAVIERDEKTLRALRSVRDIALDMAQACRDHDWEGLPALFQKEFEARTQLAKSFTSPQIDSLRDLAAQNGGDAVKICGAGGGGCVFIWTSPDKKGGLAQACRESGFQVLDAVPVQSS